MNFSNPGIYSAALLLFSMSMAHAVGPNPNVKYFGYDWVDFPGETANSALAAINSTGPAETNLNVVHDIIQLNSQACNGKKCAVNFSAGHYQHFDICPDSFNYSQCLQKNPWQTIWGKVAEIASSQNKPQAIYFLDEPSYQRALQDYNSYVPWSYASFVCTLRDALNSYKLDIPVFTVLAMGELPANPDDPNTVMREIRNQMPSSGCPSHLRSTPDWIGIDNYEWKHEVGVRDDSPRIYATYNKYFPSGGTYPKWVLVPPSHTSLVPSPATDQRLKDGVQVYWDMMAGYPQAPIVYVMAFRFDRNVMTTLQGVDPNDHSNPMNPYWRTRNLLKFMGNSIIN